MSGLQFLSQPDKLMLVAFMIYLAGAATPLMLLRLVTDEKHDSCFLSFLVWAIASAIGVSSVLLFI